MESSLTQQPEPDVDAGAVDEPEVGGSTPSPDPGDAAAPTPAPEACHGEGEATGEGGGASGDPAAEPEPVPDPRIAELEAERDRLTADLARLASEAEAAGKAHAATVAELTAARDEAARTAQETRASLESTVNEWGLEKARAKILKELGKEEFIGRTPQERETAAFDLTTLILDRLQATRDDKGDWDVRGKAGTPYEGTTGSRVIEFLCDRYAYLFKDRQRSGGAGMVGQDRGGRAHAYDYAPAPRPGSIDAIAARMKALRRPSSP